MADHKTRTMTIRLPEDLADELELVARVDEMPVSEAVRAAIAAHIAMRRRNLAFQDRLRERVNADRRILERLADQEVGRG